MQIELKFDDPEVEREYVQTERANRLVGTRLIIGIAAVTLLSYIVFNPLNMTPSGVIDYNIAASIFLAVLLSYFGLSYTQAYITRGWIDIPIFIAVAVPMLLLIDALAGQAAVTGISRSGISIVNMGMLVVFASLGFVATRKYFWAWSALVLVIYLALLIGADRSIASKVYSFTNFLTFFVFALFVNFDIDCRARATFRARKELEAERAKSEEMLYSILPQDIAQRLRKGEAVADAFSDVTVIFIDIVGFSRLTKALSPGMLVELLNTIFGIADDAADKHGVEKVKTIGDAYLAVSGGHASKRADSEAAIAFGADVIAGIEAHARAAQIDVGVRVGIHTGPVVGGVIGTRRMAYDYWGDTMNIASRIENIAEPGGIAVSEATFYSARNSVEFTGPETIGLKGVGDLQVYRVVLPVTSGSAATDG